MKIIRTWKETGEREEITMDTLRSNLRLLNFPHVEETINHLIAGGLVHTHLTGYSVA